MSDRALLSREQVIEAIRTHELAVEGDLHESTDLTLMLAQDCRRYMDALKQIVMWPLGLTVEDEAFRAMGIARAALAGKERVSNE